MTSGADDNILSGTAPSPQRKRSTRVPYFQRPQQPRDWRWVVGGIGKMLITLGLLMFAFVGYQLWGTGIQTARAQNDLEAEFNRLMQSTTSVAATTTSTTAVATTDSTLLPPESTIAVTSTVPVAPDAPPISNGDAVARIEIPKIDLNWIVVQGTEPNDLAKGPGHFRETPMPGQLGNAAIAGHRTTHGAPFGDLNELEPGDLITVIMANGAGTFVYSVTRTIIVSSQEYAAVIPTIDPTVATLTLATCHPKFTSEKRMIVQAVLVPEQSGQVMAPPANTVPIVPIVPESTLPSEPSDTALPATTVAAGSATQTTGVDAAEPTTSTIAAADDGAITEDGLSGGWFDDSAAIAHALAWGLLLLAVGIGSYFVGKATNRLYISFVVGLIPFVVVLYFFFENVNRLLPPGL